MKKSATFLLLFACLTLSAQDRSELKHYVDEATQPYRASKSGHALVVGVVYQGQQYFYSYGNAPDGSNMPVGPKSIFEIGEVTEVFTTSLLADMVMKGEVSLSDPLEQFMPKNMRIPSYTSANCQLQRVPIISDILNTPLYVCEPTLQEQQYPIQLCDLATQTTGFPARKGFRLHHRENPFAMYSVPDLYHFLTTYPFTPNLHQYRYSPLNIALLGHALSLKTGKEYEELLQEKLLDQLGLADTRIELTTEQLSRRLLGHTRSGRPAANWTFQALAPAGALHSSAHDLLLFVAAHLGLGKEKLFYSLALTHQPRYPVNRHSYIGLGWMVTSMNSPDEKAILESKGQTGGYSAYLGFTRSSGIGVVILSNTARPVDAMGANLLESLQQLLLSVQRP